MASTKEFFLVNPLKFTIVPPMCPLCIINNVQPVPLLYFMFVSALMQNMANPYLSYLTYFIMCERSYQRHYHVLSVILMGDLCSRKHGQKLILVIHILFCSTFLVENTFIHIHGNNVTSMTRSNIL